MKKVIYFCVLVLLLSILIGIIISQNTTYQVVTFDNEIIKVNSYELYSNKMYIYKDNEKILIKSYRRVE